MHEYSIVQALLNQCEDIAYQNGATEVEKIICKIGVMSGIEIHLLKIAFDTFKEGTLCQNAKLIINEQKLKLHCSKCTREFEVNEPIYTCERCGDPCHVIDGEEMYLMSLELTK